MICNNITLLLSYCEGTHALSYLDTGMRDDGRSWQPFAVYCYILEPGDRVQMGALYHTGKDQGFEKLARFRTGRHWLYLCMGRRVEWTMVKHDAPYAPTAWRTSCHFRLLHIHMAKANAWKSV